MTNGDIGEVLLPLDQSMTTHVNRGIEPRVNAIESTNCMLIHFARMNRPIFLCSKVGEVPKSL